jgi:hypothetical protein
VKEPFLVLDMVQLSSMVSLSNNLACSKYCCQNLLQRNKEVKPYRHKVIKYWDTISLVYCMDHANGKTIRTAAESSKKMAEDFFRTRRRAAYHYIKKK